VSKRSAKVSLAGMKVGNMDVFFVLVAMPMMVLIYFVYVIGRNGKRHQP